MNAREALKALVDGHKVRAVNDPPGTYLVLDSEGTIQTNRGTRWGTLSELLRPTYEAVDFELFEEPATDEELIAEMERRAQGRASHVVAVYKECANMLKTRKVKP